MTAGPFCKVLGCHDWFPYSGTPTCCRSRGLFDPGLRLSHLRLLLFVHLYLFIVGWSLLEIQLLLWFRMWYSFEVFQFFDMEFFSTCRLFFFVSVKAAVRCLFHYVHVATDVLFIFLIFLFGELLSYWSDNRWDLSPILFSWSTAWHNLLSSLQSFELSTFPYFEIVSSWFCILFFIYSL